jgi:hypothetical protein
MNSHDQNIACGPWILASLGFVLTLLGVARFILRHHFGFADALYCVLVVVPSGILLLVFDYVLHHAKLVAVIPLLFAGLMLYTFPVFDVALGLTLIGAMAGPALSEWRNENRPGKSNPQDGPPLVL